MKVYTSNIFTIIITIDTATRGPITRATIGGTIGTSTTIHTTTIITTINAMTGATSVIIKITSDTDGATSIRIIHFIIITIISIPQIIIMHIRIVRANNIPLRQVELTE